MKTRFSCRKSFLLKFLCVGILSITTLFSVPFVTSCGSGNKSSESSAESPAGNQEGAANNETVQAGFQFDDGDSNQLGDCGDCFVNSEVFDQPGDDLNNGGLFDNYNHETNPDYVVDETHRDDNFQ